MVSSGRSGRFASTVVFWQWALGIGVGAACAGAVFVVGSQHVATRVAVTEPGLAGAASPIEATGVASIGGTPLTTASLDLPIIPSAEPPVMLPPDKPVLKPRSAISKVFRVRETPADVAHFDSCLPSCETRDPLVAGVDAPAPAAPLGTLPVASVPGTSMPAPSMPVAPAPVASAPPEGPVPPLPLLDPVGGEPIPMAPQRGPVDLAVDSGKALVKGVEATSGAVVKGTRRAVDAAVDLLW